MTLLSNTGDVTLRPEVEGEYVYSLVSLSDDRYHDGVAVAGEVRGSVRPVATADFGLRPGSAVGSGRGLERQLRLWECEARQVELDVSVGRGSPPFALEFLTSTAADSKAETVTLGSVGTHWLTLPVPTELAAAGGNYTIGLSGIRDGNGCSRKLDKQPVRVEVRVGRPTAKIAGSAADRVLVVTEGTTVNVPLRLTGEGVRPDWACWSALAQPPASLTFRSSALAHQPWTVKYQSSKLSAPIEEKIRAANTDFAFRDAAVYKLLSVRRRPGSPPPALACALTPRSRFRRRLLTGQGLALRGLDPHRPGHVRDPSPAQTERLAAGRRGCRRLQAQELDAQGRLRRHRGPRRAPL